MRPAVTISAFALGLAAVFAGAVGVGNAAGPVGVVDAASHGAEEGEENTADAEGGDHGDMSDGAAAAPEGLSATLNGYTLRLGAATAPLALESELSFVVTGPDGQPVTAYTPTHDKDLHLILVRRDGTGFQHLHPTRDALGTWRVPVTLPTAGSYKVFTDTQPAAQDEAFTLAADLEVAGNYEPSPQPPVSRVAEVDGYTVTLTGELVAGRASPLTLSVSREGRPVTDLEPYLAAYGHLVSLREGDLAYLHTHPEGAPGDGRTAAGPEIGFDVDVPSPGTYRLYLDFQHDGVVRTAEFTATATGSTS